MSGEILVYTMGYHHTIVTIEEMGHVEPNQHQFDCVCEDAAHNSLTCDLALYLTKAWICDGGYECCSKKKITHDCDVLNVYIMSIVLI